MSLAVRELSQPPAPCGTASSRSTAASSRTRRSGVLLGWRTQYGGGDLGTRLKERRPSPSVLLTVSRRPWALRPHPLPRVLRDGLRVLGLFLWLRRGPARMESLQGDSCGVPREARLRAAAGILYHGWSVIRVENKKMCSCCVAMSALNY